MYTCVFFAEPAVLLVAEVFHVGLFIASLHDGMNIVHVMHGLCAFRPHLIC
jgi:hypothetical protein